MRPVVSSLLLLLLLGCGAPDLGPEDLHFSVSAVSPPSDVAVPSLHTTASGGAVHLAGYLPVDPCAMHVDVAGRRGAHDLTLIITTLPNPAAACRAALQVLRYEVALESVAPGPFTAQVYWTRQFTERQVLAGAAQVTVP